jgi:DNA polymerase III delta subunit
MSQAVEILPRVYFLTGDDTVGKERYRITILEKIKLLHKQHTVNRFDHAEGDLNKLIEDILTPSLFQDTRIFIIAHADQFNEKELKRIDKILKNPLSDVYIFIEAGTEKKSVDGGGKISKVLQIVKRSEKEPSVFVHKEFPRPPEYRVAEWLVAQVPSLFARSISKKDADYLIDLAGNDIDLLHSELQKIDIHLDRGAPVNRQIIEQIVGPSRQMTVFELATALGMFDFPRSLTIVSSLFATTFAAPIMVAALFRYFWALLRIKKFAHENPGILRTFTQSKGFNNPSQNEAALAIGQAAGLLGPGDIRKVYPVIIASGVVGQSQKFTEDELKQILKWLLEFDVGVKTGRVDASQKEVQLLCYRIVRVSELIKGNIAS